MQFAVEPRAGWGAELEDLGAVAASVCLEQPAAHPESRFDDRAFAGVKDSSAVGLGWFQQLTDAQPQCAAESPEGLQGGIPPPDSSHTRLVFDNPVTRPRSPSDWFWASRWVRRASARRLACGEIGSSGVCALRWTERNLYVTERRAGRDDAEQSE